MNNIIYVKLNKKKTPFGFDAEEYHGKWEDNFFIIYDKEGNYIVQFNAAYIEFIARIPDEEYFDWFD